MVNSTNVTEKKKSVEYDSEENFIETYEIKKEKLEELLQLFPETALKLQDYAVSQVEHLNYVRT